MSILSAIKQQQGSLDDLAALPQATIMQMAQKKQISAEMVAPILSRKAELMDSVVRTKQAQGAGQVPPTVMEGLMAKNAMAEAPQVHETGIAQLPIPERQYAGGGIIAFAEGDYIDMEDRDEDEEFSEYQQAMQMAMQNGARSRNIEGEAMAAPRAAPQATPKEVTQERVTHKIQPATGDHPYKEMVAKDAVKYGVDPNISTRLLQNETGGLKNPETAKSKAGALGIAQFMPATAKQYGIDPTDPKQASDAMNKHVHYLMKQYGDPQLVAIAYNWGEGNTNKWLAKGADPDKLPKETQAYLHKFMHKAMAQGGTVQGYAEGGSIESMPYAERMKSVFGYSPDLGPAAVRYMTGGAVKGYSGNDGMSEVDALGAQLDAARSEFGAMKAPGLRQRQQDPKAYESYLEKQARLQSLQQQYEKMMEGTSVGKPALLGGPRQADPMVQRMGAAAPVKPTQQARPSTPPVAAAAAPIAAAAAQNASGPVPEQDIGFGPGKFSPEEDVIKQAQGAAVKQSRYDKYLDMMEKRMQGSDKQRQTDQNMALIAAGLGIMGGDSPYAMQNIGKGALHGVQYYADATKQRAAEENAGMRNVGQLLRYKELGDITEENRAASKENKKIEQGQRERIITETERKNKEGELERIENRLGRSAEASLKAAGLLTMDTSPEETMRLKQQWVEKEKSKDKRYRKTYKEAYGEDYESEVPVQEPKKNFKIVK